MARPKVKLNTAGVLEVFDQWADGDGAARAERIAAEMRENAPVKTGNYRDHIEVRRVNHRGRPVFQVGSTSPHAHLVEASTGNAARALDAAGGA